MSDSDNESLGEDIFTDEISEFTETRNKVDLDDKEDKSEDEEALFALGSASDESDEEIEEWSKRLKQIKFQTKRDGQKIRPDVLEKSWGKKRTDFYGSGVRRKLKDAGTDEEDEWVMEEKEMEKLQKRMDEEIDEEDFLVPALTKRNQETASSLKVTRDLSEQDREQYNRQAHPEVEPLREELNRCMEKVQALKARSKGWMFESRNTVYRLLGANIAFYLHLLESQMDTRGHPVLKRILQWKKLAKIYDGIEDDEDYDSVEEREDDAADLEVKRPRLHVEASDAEQSEESGGDEEDPNATDSRVRPVTYEIEKNKPRKKTAPNNPRVKHREKYRKAKIRRKGKIREYRPEVTKYQGELSGIRSGIVRSVRLN